MNDTPRRETYPLLVPGDTLVMVWRDHLLASALPSLFVTALQAGAQVRLDSGADLDTDSFPTGTVSTFNEVGHKIRLSPPDGIFSPLNKVSVLHVLRGRVAADLRSMGEVRTYLKQPFTLSGNTGGSGGWPFGPNPV